MMDLSLAGIASNFYKEVIWRFNDTEKKLYLTFDDGPSGNLTNWILKVLASYQAKATFFCLGRNVERFPGQYQRIINDGHVVGNHSYNHLKGWKTKNASYYEDIEKAHGWIQSNYFRPPHGKLRPSQLKELKQSYKIVLWDVLTKDYRQDYEPARIYRRITRKTRKGSILVFHDSLEAEANLKQVLPDILNYYHNQGYTFCSLPPG
jgi:peptidoglycan/xylan/chitin deacetylase (PgdA/CDA1 family)